MKTSKKLQIGARSAEQTEMSAVADVNALLAGIVEYSDDAIISKSLQGRITSWNKSAERIFGYAANEAIGCNISMLIPADRQDEEPLILELLSRGERVDHFETTRVAKNGEQIHVSLTISPIRNSAGTIIGVSKIARNITDKKRLYEELYASQQLAKEVAESASKAKDRFIAMLSHELRTPLNPALLIVQMLESERSLSDEQKSLLATARRNIELEIRLIDDMLDLTAIANGKIKISLETIDLHQQIRNVVRICEAEIHSKQQKLEMEMRADHTHIRGDPARIQQILWNLLRNAAKFTPTGGEIHVDTRDAGPGQIEITVCDSGIGIDKESLPRIFEAFEQGQQVNKGLGGLGLGLSISQSLVQMHGGTLKAESEGNGKGTKFLLRFSVAA